MSGASLDIQGLKAHLPMQGTQVWQLNQGAATAEDTLRDRAPHGENPPQREAHSRSQRQPLLIATRGSPRRDPARLSINTDALSHTGALTQPLSVAHGWLPGVLCSLPPRAYRTPWAPCSGPGIWDSSREDLAHPPWVGVWAEAGDPPSTLAPEGTGVKTRGREAVRGLGRGQTLRGELTGPLTARL